MGIVNALRSLLPTEQSLTSLELRTSLESGATPLASAAAFTMAFGGEPTVAGELVTEANALTISTVYACVRLIAESVAGIPLRVYENTSKGKNVASTHSLSYLLTCQPNAEMSAVTFIESVTGSMALTGNGYAEIERDTVGAPIALWPLHPLITKPVRRDDGTLVYETRGKDSETRTLAAKDVIHVPLFSFDGLKGLSPIEQARQTLGLAQATLKQGARFFGNGSRPGGLLVPKQPISSDQGQQMRKAWEQMSSGVNQGRIAVLPSDWSYTQLGMSLEDSQFLQARAFSRNEIAALFRVDSHYLGDTTRQSNANHEQMALSLLQDTLAPYLTKITQEFMRKLFPPTGKQFSKYFLAFDHTERLRTDLKTTLDALAVGRQWGLLTANEGRQQLGLNPVGKEGDVLYSPINMMDSRRFVDWFPTKQTPSPKEQE